MPVWHNAARDWVKNGKLVLLGVTQEQHAERCRLFAQWQQFDWPILHDPVNVLETAGVPVLVAIDEHGIVRGVKPDVKTFEADFLNKEFRDDDPQAGALVKVPPDLADLKRHAETAKTASAWRALGDALAIWSGPARSAEAVAAYSAALAIEPADATTLFRLGVAYRMRFES